MTGRLLLLLLIPPAVFGAIVFVAVSAQYRDTSLQYGAQYGQATADQLAQHLVRYLVENDVLSLNVVVNRMVKTGHAPFIAVYDERNSLVAQAGRQSRADASFTSEMSFQDATVGFVRVAVSRPAVDLTGTLALLMLVYAAYGIALWRFRDLLEGLGQVLQATIGDETESEKPADNLVEVTERGPVEHSILVVRIRPAHHLERHFDKFYQAARQFHGIVEQTTTEELVIHFESADSLYLAACAGSLMQQVARLASNTIRFGGTLTLIDTDSERQRKAASYLASLASNELLISSGADRLSDRAEVQRFHHSLVDSRDVRRVVNLINADELLGQAQKIVR